jgi:hypothetical protein
MDINSEVRATRMKIMEDLVEVSGLTEEQLYGENNKEAPPIPDFDVKEIATDVLLKVVSEADLERTEVTCNSFLDYLKKQRS